MSQRRRRFTPAFKLHVVREIEAGKPVAEAAREHQLHPNLIYRWKRQYREGGFKAFASPHGGTAPGEHAKVAEPRAPDWAAHHRERLPKKRLGAPRSRAERCAMTEAIKETTQALGPGHVQRLCQAAGLPRATYYRLRDEEPVADEKKVHLRSQIQEIALKWPAYGYRRITAELRRRGVRANHKRVLPISACCV